MDLDGLRGSHLIHFLSPFALTFYVMTDDCLGGDIRMKLPQLALPWL